MSKPTLGPAVTAVTGAGCFRVITHAPLCPGCGSGQVSTEEVDMADGTTEAAYLCQGCGDAWPVTCVTDWTPTAGTTRKAASGHG